MAYIGVLPRKNIGEEHGQALHESLGQLADYKFQEMMKRNERSRQEQNYTQAGLSPEFAKIIVNADPKERSALMQIYPQLEQLKQQQGQSQSTNGQPQQNGTGFQNFMASRQNQAGASQGGVMPQYSPGQYNQIQNQNIPQQQQRTSEGMSPAEVWARGYEPANTRFQREKEQNKDIRDTLNRNQKQSQFVQKQNLAQAKALDINKTIDRVEKSKNLIDQYDRLIENARSGETYSGPLANFLESQGVNSMITNPLTNISDKEAQDIFTNEFMGLKLGGRPSERMFETIAKGYANLRQYPESLVVVAGLKKFDSMKRNLIDEKEVELFQKYEQEGRNIAPSSIRNMATKMVQPQLDAISEQTKNFYDKEVFDILLKSKKTMGGGYTGKTYKDINEVSSNLKVGGKVKNDETGEVFIKTKDGLKKASYINGDWRV